MGLARRTRPSDDEVRVVDSIEADEDAVSSARAAPLRPRGARRRQGGAAGGLLGKIRARVRGRGSELKSGVPRYLIFNQHILSGYRVNFTVRDSLYSLFTLHNESINIWTHVFGFVLFLVLAVALCWAPHTMLDVTQAGANETSAKEGGVVPGVKIEAPVTWAATPDAAALYTEPILLLQKARKRLGKALHLDEAKDNLRKILKDVEINLFRGKEKSKLQPAMIKTNFKKTLKFLQKELKKRNVGKALHVDEVRGKLLELETQLRAIITKNFKVEYWPMFVYLVGAMFCMASSSMAHTFSICSPKANMWWWRIDYVGIAVMISTSFCPVVYYVFLNEVVWRNFYLVLILALGSLVATVSLMERFQRDDYRFYRAFLFIAFGMFSIIPLIHAFFLHWKDPIDSQAFNRIIGYELMMGAQYLGGALVYATQFPECAFPGKFDLFFNSHQVFHVAIVLAAYTHYIAVVEAIEWRYGGPSAGIAL
mmetsp:Transcript_1476/g.5564  ORF Transcript_1476/g.5564 Transcript_1476/m.5564 type:complete len:481 (-) Transcript_1476:2403-3845(-)